MGLIVLLIANGVLLRRVESRLRGGIGEPDLGWRRLRRFAAASLALWFGSALLGTALLS